jgi:hypothetical protein
VTEKSRTGTRFLRCGTQQVVFPVVIARRNGRIFRSLIFLKFRLRKAIYFEALRIIDVRRLDEAAIDFTSDFTSRSAALARVSLLCNPSFDSWLFVQ